jgi:3-oxoacyl-[acyl-carrier protein] reductase
MNTELPLHGRKALVTGAAGALGAAIARSLHRAGADVVLNDLDPAKLREIGQSFPPERTQLVAADVTDEAAVRGMFEEAGPLSILVNNAGIARAQNILEMSLADWEMVMRVNLTSVFLCTREFLRRIGPGGWGRVVNISSVSGQQGAVFGHAHYSASKAGMIGFTKAVARTAAPLGVTVNVVAPGIIETALVRETLGTGREDLAETIPLGLGVPEDVAAAVLYLCSPQAGYVTGSTLDVNGGLYFR